MSKPKAFFFIVLPVGVATFGVFALLGGPEVLIGLPTFLFGAIGGLAVTD